MKHRLELRLLGEYQQPQICRWYHPYDRNEEQQSFLMKVKEESEKVRLKLNIQKTKIMTSGSLISWQIDGKNKRLYFWGLQNHCRW